MLRISNVFARKHSAAPGIALETYDPLWELMKVLSKGMHMAGGKTAAVEGAVDKEAEAAARAAEAFRLAGPPDEGALNAITRRLDQKFKSENKNMSFPKVNEEGPIDYDALAWNKVKARIQTFPNATELGRDIMQDIGNKMLTAPYDESKLKSSFSLLGYFATMVDSVIANATNPDRHKQQNAEKLQSDLGTGADDTNEGSEALHEQAAEAGDEGDPFRYLLNTEGPQIGNEIAQYIKDSDNFSASAKQEYAMILSLIFKTDTDKYENKSAFYKIVQEESKKMGKGDAYSTVRNKCIRFMSILNDIRQDPAAELSPSTMAAIKFILTEGAKPFLELKVKDTKKSLKTLMSSGKASPEQVKSMQDALAAMTSRLDVLTREKKFQVKMLPSPTNVTAKARLQHKSELARDFISQYTELLNSVNKRIDSGRLDEAQLANEERNVQILTSRLTAKKEELDNINDQLTRLPLLMEVSKLKKLRARFMAESNPQRKQEWLAEILPQLKTKLEELSAVKARIDEYVAKEKAKKEEKAAKTGIELDPEELDIETPVEEPEAAPDAPEAPESEEE